MFVYIRGAGTGPAGPAAGRRTNAFDQNKIYF